MIKRKSKYIRNSDTQFKNIDYPKDIYGLYITWALMGLFFSFLQKGLVFLGILGLPLIFELFDYIFSRNILLEMIINQDEITIIYCKKKYRKKESLKFNRKSIEQIILKKSKSTFTIRIREENNFISYRFCIWSAGRSFNKNYFAEFMKRNKLFYYK